MFVLFGKISRGGNPFEYNLTTILYLMNSDIIGKIANKEKYILDDAI